MSLLLLLIFLLGCPSRTESYRFVNIPTDVDGRPVCDKGYFVRYDGHTAQNVIDCGERQ